MERINARPKNEGYLIATPINPVYSKMVKKVLGLLMVGLITVLTGCERFYEIYRPVDKMVIKVELIYYNNPDARDNPSVMYCFDWDKFETLETLDETQIEYFITDLVNIAGLGIPDSGVLNSHDGKGIRITYEDNTFDIITLTKINTNDENRFYYSSFDENNNRVSGRDIYASKKFENKFNELLDQYFPVE